MYTSSISKNVLMKRMQIGSLPETERITSYACYNEIQVDCCYCFILVLYHASMAQISLTIVGEPVVVRWTLRKNVTFLCSTTFHWPIVKKDKHAFCLRRAYLDDISSLDSNHVKSGSSYKMHVHVRIYLSIDAADGRSQRMIDGAQVWPKTWKLVRKSDRSIPANVDCLYISKRWTRIFNYIFIVIVLVKLAY